MIQVERALLGTCEACGGGGGCTLISTPVQRLVICDQCTSDMMLQVSNIMLPLIAERLEQRRHNR